MTRRGSGARAALALTVLLALAAACSGRGCSGCACSGSPEEAPRVARAGDLAEPEPERAGAAEEPAGEPEEPPADLPADEEDGGAATTAPSPPVEEAEEPGAAGSAVGDRPTSGQVGAVLRGLRDQAAGCSRGVRRSVVLEVTIAGRTGRVMTTRAIGPTAGTPEAACVEALVRRAEFPTFARAEMTVAYAYGLPGESPAATGAQGADGGEPEARAEGGGPAGDAGDPDAGGVAEAARGP